MSSASRKSKARSTKATTAVRPAAVHAEPSHERIALEAFLIWEQQGRPHGFELQHWLEAEQRVRSTATA